MNLDALIDIAPLEYRSIACCLLGSAVIGVERQLMGKPIGIRTSALICLGTYVFVAMSHSLTSTQMDPSRIVGQVITGIGFLGAGVMFSRDGTVQGVTSAAAIWILAAIGVVVGLGHAMLGVKLGFLTVALLVGVEKIERSFTFMQRGVHQRVKQYRAKHAVRSKHQSNQ